MSQIGNITLLNSSPFTLAPYSWYASNTTTLCSLTLPATCPVGGVILVIGLNTGGWQIGQNAGQNINYNGASSTVGISGSIASTTFTDTIWLLCTEADTTFNVFVSQGTLQLI